MRDEISKGDAVKLEPRDGEDPEVLSVLDSSTGGLDGCSAATFDLIAIAF